MRFVSINGIREGMILAKDIVGKNGELLLKKGAILHSSYINRIKSLGYNGLYIVDELSSDIEIKTVIDENLRLKTVNTVKNAFINIENSGVISKQTFESMDNLISNIVDEIIANNDIMVNMIDLKTFDDYTFYHSVNVAVLSVLVGCSFNFNRQQLKNLGLSATLHDIGKVFIPKEILNKKDKLTEYEYNIVKTHPVEGYNHVKENCRVPPVTYVGILQHHERFDGSGYPMSLKGKKISLFGRIISVADVFDALTSNRPYRKAMSPSEAIEFIMGGGGTYFDPDVIIPFTEKIAPYPVGTSVRLSNGCVAIVVKNYRDCPVRPVIKVIKEGNEMVKPYFLDLKNDKNTIDITIIGFDEN